ncbi:hypothetical protein I7I51_06871 [Histoplasma capsulatum]|uniref:MYB DNA-binding domain-containing protein n=1 Tax=Ajellomyces capsulatus TaxID=5037 RepID=A0A8A1MLI7_AJECA|nr:hypothetical protein I7I51_06871 [Histoplasma capsulatum]
MAPDIQNNASQVPARKQSEWSPEEHSEIIRLRARGIKWEDISKKLPGRSSMSCRLHYYKYLKRRRSDWDENRKNRLARLYQRWECQRGWRQATGKDPKDADDNGQPA